MNDKNNMDIVLNLIVDKFKSQIKQMGSLAKKTGEEMQESLTVSTTPSFKGKTAQQLVDEGVVSWKNASDDVKDYTENVNKSEANMGKMFKNMTKQGTKFLLSLFSIRSAWALLSRASSTYLQENQQLAESVKLISSTLGNTLGPAIKYIVGIAEYGVILIARLVENLFKIDVLGAVTANAMKSIAKETKKANSALASFDTITNLSDNTDAMESLANKVSALEEFKKKIAEVDANFKNWSKYIYAAVGALAVLYGAKTIAGLGNLIGMLSGAAGYIGILTGTAIVLTIAAAVETYKTLEILKELNKQYLSLQENMNLQVEKEEEQMRIIRERIKAGKEDNETIKKYIKTREDAIKIGKAENEGLRENLTFIGEITGANKELRETIYLNAIETAKYAEDMQELLKYTELTDEEQNDYVNALESAREQMIKARSTVKENSAEYQTLTKKIESVTDNLEELTGKNWSTEVQVTANTDKFKNAMSKVFGFISDKDILGGGLVGKTATKWFSWLNSFDVGTNYVPNDQLAMVHKGEMIVPAKYNPVTSGIGSNNETNDLLRTLIDTIDQKEFSTYLDGREIGKSTVNYINSESRIMGRSVIK